MQLKGNDSSERFAFVSFRVIRGHHPLVFRTIRRPRPPLPCRSSPSDSPRTRPSCSSRRPTVFDHSAHGGFPTPEARYLPGSQPLRNPAVPGCEIAPRYSTDELHAVTENKIAISALRDRAGIDLERLGMRISDDDAVLHLPQFGIITPPVERLAVKQGHETFLPLQLAEQRRRASRPAAQRMPLASNFR